MQKPKEEMLPLLKSLEEDLSRLTEKQKMVEKLTPSGKMVETEMAQLFSKLKDRFLDLSEDLAALKQLIEQWHFGYRKMVDIARETANE
ncbi:MAG: hypothetical protein M1495_18655 [Bacteroidetes bacterium]|nr:hypothetical protein [Bacteroidota bacterium]